MSKEEKMNWEEHEWQHILYHNKVCKKCGIIFGTKGIYWTADHYSFSANTIEGYGLDLQDSWLTNHGLASLCCGSKIKLIEMIIEEFEKEANYWKNALKKAKLEVIKVK